MSDIKLDKTTHDIALLNGDMQIIGGKEAIDQHLTMRMKLFKGEIVFDIVKGVDYLGAILGKGADLEFAELEMGTVITNTPGIVSFDGFENTFDPVKRSFDTKFQVITSEGDDIDFSANDLGA